MKHKLKKSAAAIGAAGVAAAGLLWVTFGKGRLPAALPAYEAVRVIDGDTFVTKEDQHIRVASTEAPELGLCGGEAAKKQLEKLILGRPLYLKVVYRDFYQRLVSLVYAGNVFVNQAMINDGYSYYERSSPGEIGKELQQASAKAREQKKGIFGAECTPPTNTRQPQCLIKGNLGQTDKIYYLPDCGVYPNVQLELYKGDQWFCTEKEAIKAGFRKPSQCP